MLLDTIFAPFVKERPVCVMARASVERLLAAQRLDALVARTAERPYPRELLFSSLVQLMSAVVLGVHPTVHAASQANTGASRGSTTALDNQLDRVETGVSAALVRAAAALAEPVIKAWRASHPRWLPGYHSKVRAGNHCSATEHRLQAVRGTWAAPLAGQALVGLDQPRLGSPEVLLQEDGQAQERRLLAAVLQHVKADDLWSEERHFCTLGLMCGMARRGAACVVRQHGQVQGACRGRATRQGTTRRAPGYAPPRFVREPESGATLRGRRRTIARTAPTRDGATARHLLAHVPSSRASAAQLARLYGKRWSLATACFELTTPLSCERNTLGYPKAALFPCCLAWLADNAVSLINAARRSAHGRQKVHDEVSGSARSLALGRTYDGLMSAIPAPHWALFRERSAKAFAKALRELASSMHLAS